jgi:hypothetical protein
MSVAEVLAAAKSHSVEVRLNSAGQGLTLSFEDDPPGEVVDRIKNMKAEFVAHLQAERGRINHWIAGNLIDWPPSHCLHCRKPIIVRQPWVVISNGEVSARFHQDCHGAWLAQQEEPARRAMGLK